MSMFVHRHGLIARPFYIFEGASVTSTATAPAGTLSTTWNERLNKNSQFDTSTSTWTVPTTGLYHYYTTSYAPGGVPSGNNRSTSILYNGGSNHNATPINNSYASGGVNHTGAGRVIATTLLQAGVDVTMQSSHDATGIHFGSFKVPNAVGEGFHATFSGSSSPTTSPAATTVTNYKSVSWNSSGSFNATTGIYTVPEDGVYYLFAQGYSFGSADSGQQLRINGVSYAYLNKAQQYGSNNGDTNPISVVLTLSAGDQLSFYPTTYTVSWVSFGAMKIDGLNHYFGAVERTGLDGNNVGTGWTERADSGSDFNPTTGVYTIPEDGVYFFGATSMGVVAGPNTQLTYLRINGTDAYFGLAFQNTAGYRASTSAQGLQYFSAGDQVTAKFIGGQIANSATFFGFMVASDAEFVY